MSRRYDATTAGDWLARIVLAIVFCVTVVAVLLPGATLGWMRQRWGWFTYPIDRIESLDSPVNLVHVMLFAALGITTKMAAPQWRLPPVTVAFVLLAIGTELLQILVPDRDPRIADVLVDIISGVGAWAAIHAWRGRRKS